MKFMSKAETDAFFARAGSIRRHPPFAIQRRKRTRAYLTLFAIAGATLALGFIAMSALGAPHETIGIPQQHGFENGDQQ